MAWWQSETTWRADLKNAPTLVQLKRPAQRAEIAGGQQVSRLFEQANPRVPDTQKTELGAAARSQSTTPRSEPTTSIRPSCRIDGFPYWLGTLVAWANVRYSRAGSTWYVVNLSSYSRDDSSVVAEVRAKQTRRSSSARVGPGPDPRAAAGLPSRCSPAMFRRGERRY